MTKLFALNASWPDPAGDENRLFIGISAMRFRLLPRKYGMIVFSSGCATIDELKASIERLKNELDALILEGEGRFSYEPR